jgi:hypothetical protein
MKKIFLLLVLFSLLGCEKDDICDENTATTPLLVLEFFRADNPTIIQNVTSLKITANGQSEFGTFSGVSKIKLPLNTVADLTKYKLTLNSSSTTAINTDYLQFNYARNEVFVSRACGFKTTYTLNATGGVVRTDETPADTTWITSFTILTSNIEKSNETHIKIFF